MCSRRNRMLGERPRTLMMALPGFMCGRLICTRRNLPAQQGRQHPAPPDCAGTKLVDHGRTR